MDNKRGLSFILKKSAPVSGIIALVVLSFFVSWKDVWVRFKEVNRLYLIPSTLFNIAFIVAETLRLKWVLGYPRLEELLRIFSLSRLIGVGTVHLAGEGALMAGLKLSGVSLKSGASAILYLRCLDLGVLCLIVGLYGTTYFNLSISLVGFGLVAFFFWNGRRFPFLGKVILSSLFMYLFFASSVIASAMAVGIEIGKINVIRVSAVGVLSQALPLTPLGLGTRDLSLIALFSSFGVPPEEALVFSWVEFIVVTIISLSLIYVMSWIWEMLKGKKSYNK
jgi:uncharacterized membrane protein YbhN (UPF0104 family)